MDINDIRSLITLLSFGLFSGIAVFAYLPRNRRRYDEAAQLPFQDEGDLQ